MLKGSYVLHVSLYDGKGKTVSVNGPFKLEVLFGLASVSNTYAHGAGMLLGSSCAS